MQNNIEQVFRNAHMPRGQNIVFHVGFTVINHPQVSVFMVCVPSPGMVGLSTLGILGIPSGLTTGPGRSFSWRRAVPLFEAMGHHHESRTGTLVGE